MASSKFITNKNQPLKNVFSSAVTKSAKFDFLVGYFYLSGFYEIQKDLADKDLRILVGMDTDVTKEGILIEFFKNLNGKKSGDSKQTIRTKWSQNMIKAINNADNFDTKEVKDTFKFFKEKLLNGTLHIRRTKEPNHAKMYLFYADENDPLAKQEPGKVIVGSSNLSYEGLEGRNEVNIYLQDSADFEDAKSIFNDLWDKGIDLIDEAAKQEFIDNVIEHTWLEQIPSPYLMYIKVLYEYFKANNDMIKTPNELTRGKMTEFFDVSYQIDAIRDAVHKIRKHSGVIVADVVGLGKSVIGSSIAANLDLQTVIICPPHLKDQWAEYAQDFGLRGYAIYTPGKIEDAVNAFKGRSDILVIIDEAHRYKSENTVAYGLLHQLCAGNKVVLLSATPFNNRPEDIFSMIKLFQIPAHSTIQTVNNLGDRMEELAKKYKDLKKENRESKGTSKEKKEIEKQLKSLAEEIREVLDPVVIRRTRVDLEKIEKYAEDLKAQGVEFSKINPPKELDYELGNISELYMQTLDLITGENKFTEDNEYDDYDNEIIEEDVLLAADSGSNKKEKKGFIGARYKPLTYLKKDDKIRKYYAKLFDIDNFETGQRNMAKFMQQLFVRRFESSKYSFLKTVENVLSSMTMMKHVYEKYHIVPLYKGKNMPDFELLDEFTDDTENNLFSLDELIKSCFANDIDKGLIVIKADDLTDNFIKELDHDIELFTKFHDNWVDVKEDPKLEATLENIKKSFKKEPNRKIILFSEFSDTADYLYEQFKNSGVKTMMYSSKTASKSGRDLIKACFDAGVPENLRMPKDQDFDLLIATDAISEGFSLHRAGAIYNYDIPYNPTRVIQRIGRINRINKKVFNELFIFNFFPSPTGETISHTEEISTFKMRLFQAILGSDTKILKADETTEGYMANKFVEAENESNSESWDVEYKNELHRIEKEEPELLEKAISIPLKSRCARANVDIQNKADLFDKELFEDIENKGVLLFTKKGDAFRFGFASQSGKTSVIASQVALKIFKCEKNDKSQEVSDAFYAMYQRVKDASGIVKTTKIKSGNLQEANKIFMVAKKIYSSNKNAIEYLEGVTDIANKDSFPVFYLKKIAKIDTKANDILDQIKAIIPEGYLDSLIEKDNKVGSEPETVLLAEEFI